LREVAGGMLGLSGKEETVRINHLPKKSTLSDANKCRKVEFLKKFTTTCSRNIALFYQSNSDSIRKNIKIVDSTTISLFKDIEMRWKKSY
jgi:hypothetical protein